MSLVRPNLKLCSLIHHLLGAGPGDCFCVDAEGFAFDRGKWLAALGSVGHGAVFEGKSRMPPPSYIGRNLRITASDKQTFVTLRLGPALRCDDPSSSWLGLPFPGTPSIFVGAGGQVGAWAIQSLMPTNTTRRSARLRQQILAFGAKHHLLRNIVPLQIDAQESPLLALCRQVVGDVDKPLDIAFRLGTGMRNRKTTIILSDGSLPNGYAFLQLADIPMANSYIKSSSRMMSRLCSIPSLRSAIPKLIYEGEWHGRQVLAMEGLDIMPMLSDGIPPVLLDFLADLYKETGYRAPLMDSPFFQWASELCTRLGEPSQSTLVRLKDAFEDSSVAFGCCHRDFDYKNAVSSLSGAKVIDWEWAKDGWPAPIDGLGFLTFRPDITWSIDDDPRQVCRTLLESMERRRTAIRQLLARYGVLDTQARAYMSLLFLDRGLNAFERTGKLNGAINNTLKIAQELAGA
jgi:hypothetical protein